MTTLDAAVGTRWCRQLQAALRALRLNKHFPPWAAVAGHLDGVAHLPPGQPLRLDEATLLPAPDEWLRVGIDRELAPELLPRLRAAEAAGDQPSIDKAAYLRALCDVQPLPPSSVRTSLVHEGADRARFEVVVDRLELSLPRLVRWTFRLEETAGDRFTVAELAARASEVFAQRLRVIGTQPVAATAALLQTEHGLAVLEVVRGEIGPARAHDAGPCLSALLSRASPHLEHTAVDDPLAEQVLAPADDSLGYSRLRKWAVPEAARADHLAWLASLGSRNLVYTYRS